MQRPVWGTLQRTFGEGKAICCKEPKKTNVSFCPKIFTMAEDRKANVVEEKCKKEFQELNKFKKVMGEPSTEPFGSPSELPQKTRDTTKLAQSWWNPGETSVQPWWNLPRNRSAGNQRHHET